LLGYGAFRVRGLVRELRANEQALALAERRASEALASASPPAAATDEPAVSTDSGLHTHRLEVVGRLAGGIAHDFNNTLTVILSYGELLKARLGPGHALAELAEHVVHAAEHGAALTKQLLTFTRRQVTKPRPVDVPDLLRTSERALTRVLPRSIQVHRSEPSGELFAQIDALQLQQALFNLVLNARDAMPRGGDLYLEVALEELKRGGPVPLLPGHYVVVRVRDTGTGIPPEVLSHMFEPFFTTKEAGHGTGLGLSNVREIVEASGGHVSVRSELGKGAEFALYLPSIEGRPSGIQTRLGGEGGQRPSVLVVDEDPKVREIIRTILSESGHLVRAAESGREALESLSAEPVDLVFSSLVLPDMKGAELMDRVRAGFPFLPFVISSPYGSDADMRERVHRGEAWFLAKPFTQSELLDVVGRALRARAKQTARAR
jgi:signal transduction histidine kinase/ActR/RegA family two-component response regulator